MGRKLLWCILFFLVDTRGGMSDEYDKMSDMGSQRITVRIPDRLTARLRSHSRASGASESELVREALESYLSRPAQNRSAYELAQDAGIIGAAKKAPRDLSTNRRHFKGFGKGK